MAINKVEFQTRFLIEQFIERCGTEEKCRATLVPTIRLTLLSTEIVLSRRVSVPLQPSL
jgi:hypothetical protein